MKKVLFGLLMLIVFGTAYSVSSFTNVFEAEVHLENYDNIIDLDELRVDFLVKPIYLEGVALKQEFIDVDSPYPYKIGDFYSITAYENIIDISYGNRDNRFSLRGYNYMVEDYYLVIYDTDDNVYYNELHSYTEIYERDSQQVYKWYVYDLENDELRIESKRVMTLGEFFFLISGGGVVIFAGFLLLGYIPQKRMLRKYLNDKYKKYRKHLVFISLGYYGMYVVTWWFLLETERIITYLIMFGVAVFSIRKVNRGFQHKTLSLEEIIKIEIIPLICFLIFWVVTDLVLQMSAEDGYSNIIYPVIEWIF